VLESLAICDRQGIASTRAYLMANLAEIALALQDHAGAEVHAGKGLAIAEATGNRAVSCWSRLLIARLAARRRDLATARAELASALSIASAIRIPGLLHSGAVALTDILEAQGEPECARRVLAFLVALPDVQSRLRDVLQDRLDAWQPVAPGPTPWPPLTLDELLHRGAVEAPLAHRPLIAMVRGAG
jgi:hypothetical protein